MHYDINWIKNIYHSQKNIQYIFFWKHHPLPDGTIGKQCLSQWWECNFIVDDVKYNTAEQYMMAQKALLFGDKNIFSKIMKASHPYEYKKFGRMIKNFDEKIWNENKCDIVIKGNIAKFSQNEELKNFLKKTGNKILVEASPYDEIWGIGMNPYDEGRFNPFNWNGENLLGFCLMQVRDTISK